MRQPTLNIFTEHSVPGYITSRIYNVPVLV